MFVPDGALRTVPMAALHDGKDFLIAKYAVAVSPGPEPAASRDGASRQAVEPQRRRACWRAGCRRAAAGLRGRCPTCERAGEHRADLRRRRQLLNEEFQVPAFSRELDRRPRTSTRSSTSPRTACSPPTSPTRSSLTYDGKLNLTSLESLLRPYQLQGKPIDLLTLSACQTSAGDDQAALERASLGLGGLAVKAGARSAMASLWFANDQATGELITAFYDQLRDHPEAGKAKALQQAQLALIRNEDFSHPIYWAPFLMIGDWL